MVRPAPASPLDLGVSQDRAACVPNRLDAGGGQERPPGTLIARLIATALVVSACLALDATAVAGKERAPLYGFSSAPVVTTSYDSIPTISGPAPTAGAGRWQVPGFSVRGGALNAVAYVLGAGDAPAVVDLCRTRRDLVARAADHLTLS